MGQKGGHSTPVRHAVCALIATGRRLSNWRRWAVAKRREPVRSRDVQGLKYLDKLLPLLDELHEVGCQRDKAGNRRLHYDQYCLLVLLCLFSPAGGPVSDWYVWHLAGRPPVRSGYTPSITHEPQAFFGKTRPRRRRESRDRSQGTAVVWTKSQ
jgi:hypothetical protein